MWQDYVMSCASLLFGYSLIPQVVACIREKRVQMTKQTILLTWIGVLLCNICSFSLELYISVVIGTVTFACWTMLGILKWRYREQKNKNQTKERSCPKSDGTPLKRFEYNGHVYFIRPLGPDGDTRLQGKYRFQQSSKEH